MTSPRIRGVDELNGEGKLEEDDGERAVVVVSGGDWSTRPDLPSSMPSRRFQHHNTPEFRFHYIIATTIILLLRRTASCLILCLVQ